MIKGSCLCGAVRWQIDGPVGDMDHCHCSMCRKAHGAPFATYLVAQIKDYRLLSGADEIRTYKSSRNLTRGFCGTCGSVVPLAAGQKQMVIAAGSLDDDPSCRPTAHIFANSKAPWHRITDDLPQHSAYPAGHKLDAVAQPERSSKTPGTLHGSCLCGGVAYEVSKPFNVIYNCHCSRCRKARAAAHTTNGFTSIDGLRFLKGEDLLIRYKVPEARVFTQCFCRVCGSAMPHAREESGTALVPLGSLDDDPGQGAEADIFTASKAPWYDITDDLPQFKEMPTT